MQIFSLGATTSVHIVMSMTIKIQQIVLQMIWSSRKLMLHDNPKLWILELVKLKTWFFAYLSNYIIRRECQCQAEERIT